MKQNSFINLLDELDTKLNQEYKVFRDLHEEIKQFSNRVLEKKEVEKLNGILYQQQLKFSEIYPVLSWIIDKNDICKHIIYAQKVLIKSLKKNGAESIKIQ